MKIRFALLFLWLTLPAAGAGRKKVRTGPSQSQLRSTARAPRSWCSTSTPAAMIPSKSAQNHRALGDFLDKARAAAVPIIYSVSARLKESRSASWRRPCGEKRARPSFIPTPSISFTAASSRLFSKDKGAKTLIITGSATNNAVLYTATTAARMHRYSIVIPMDGVNASSRYEQEYAIHQFTVLPSEANKLFQFTNLSMISFRQQP
jgi:Amidases related to nicotinamidase